MKDEQIEVLSLLAAHELAICELYKVYAGKFPELKDFWDELSREEIEHAEIIGKFISWIKEDKAYFKEGRFNSEEIKNSFKFVEDEFNKAKRLKTSLMNALSTTLGIEKSLIEQKFFEVIESDSEELKQTLEYLKASTLKHLEKVQKLWEQKRQKQS